MSDFDDYEIAGPEEDTNGDSDDSDETDSGAKGPRKKKKSR
jgi:hypothetical protein